MKYLLLVTFSLCIAACSNQEKVSNNQAQLDKASIVKIDSKKPSEKVPYTGLGKPSAPIKLDYSFNSEPVIGQPLDVSIKLTETNNTKPVQAALKYSPELVKTKTVNKMSFKSSAQESSQIITITPIENGIYFINIQARTDVNGQTMYKAFSIPVEVGDVDWKEHTKPEGTINNDSQGGKVISFPAAE
jgi:hypothetical protein